MGTVGRTSEWGPVIRASVAGLTLFVLDAVVVGQGFLSSLVLFLAVCVQLIFAVAKTIKGNRRRARLHLGACAIYALTFVLVWAYIVANGKMAARRADALVAACHGYEAKYGRYPERLEELIPEFITGVPRARYVVAWGEFDYYVRPAEGAERHHTLKYVVIPPFGRRLYQLEERRWSRLD